MTLISIILLISSVLSIFYAFYKNSVGKLSPLRNPKYVDSSLNRLSLHEASHAILAWSSNNVFDISYIEMDLTVGCGAVHYQYFNSKKNIARWSNIVIALGGLLIEAQQYGHYRSYDGARKDLEDIFKASYELEQMGSTVAPWPVVHNEHYVPFTKMFMGLTPKQLSILHQCYAMAFKVLCSHRGSLYKLTNFLIDRAKNTSQGIVVSDNEVVKVLYSRWFITSTLFSISRHIFLIGDSSEESFISQNLKSNNLHAEKNPVLPSFIDWLWGRY